MSVLAPIVNERTAVEFNSSVRGDDGSISVPATLKYRLDCLTTGQAVVAWTSLTPASVNTVTITAAQNAIRDDSNGFEDKVLTLLSDEGLSTQQTTTHAYRIRNLVGVP